MKRISMPNRSIPFLSGAVLAALLVLLATAGPVLAALPPPAWLPGQPMLAGNQVIAMWLPVPGAVKYNVYLDGAKVLESPANQYIGLAPTAPGRHEYKVTAVDAAGAEGPQSSAGIVEIIVVEAPKDLLPRPSSEEKAVYLRWTPPSGATIFNVYRSVSATGPFSLLTSLNEGAYKDADVEFGKTYYYTVASKDMTGKESEQSKPVEALLEKPKVSKADMLPPVDTSLLIMPAKTVRNVLAIEEDFATDQVRGAQRLSDGKIWLVSGYGYILVITDNLELVETVKLEKPQVEGMRLPKGDVILPDFLALSQDGGTIYGLVRNYLIAYDRKGKYLWHAEARYPEKNEDPALYQKRTSGTFGEPPNLASMAALDNGDLYVGGSFGWRWTFSDKGKFLGWQEGYLDADGAYVQGSNINDMLFWKGTVLCFEATGRRIFQVEPDTGKIVKIFGQVAKGFLAGFLGMGGYDVLPGTSYMAVSDPAFGSVQVFDIESGSYILSIGNETGKPDPGTAGRPLVNWTMPVYPIFIKGGKGLMVYIGDKKHFREFQFLQDIRGMADPKATDVRAKVEEWRAKLAEQ